MSTLRGLTGGAEEGWSGPVKVKEAREKLNLSVCVSAAGRAAAPGAPTVLKVIGFPRLGGHGLRLAKTGRPGGQQPREDLLHAEETASGDQDGHCVRVRAAGLQSGR